MGDGRQHQPRRFYEHAGFRPDGNSTDWPVNGALMPELRYSRDLESANHIPLVAPESA
ncbi:hypothetical protein [Streptomyces misionensis]|uniref:hypothetical protein n=1 Tax=Streptomyces misionensis TaxID=67331 RepID=UPI0036AB2015